MPHSLIRELPPSKDTTAQEIQEVILDHILSGVAASTTEVQRAVQLAKGVKGVKEVRNGLVVK